MRSEPSSHEQVGATERRPFSLSTYLVVIITFILVTAGAIWFLGYVTRVGLPVSPFPAQTNTLKLVESRNGQVLMVEERAGSSRVLVQVPGQQAWLLVSQDDTTASSPSLAPDNSSRVAYLSQRNGQKVVIASFLKMTTVEIPDAMVQDAGSQKQGITDFKICEWTPLVWSPTGSFLAFFVCSAASKVSMAFTADLGQPPVSLKPVDGSRSALLEVRQLIWQQPNQVVVTIPASGNLPARVTSLDAP